MSGSRATWGDVQGLRGMCSYSDKSSDGFPENVPLASDGAALYLWKREADVESVEPRLSLG